MTIFLALSVGLAGGLGAVARFVLDGLIRSRNKTAIPCETILINVSGSLLLGFLAGLALGNSVPAGLHLVVGTGFLGGYTTFSTANVETVRLVQSGRTGTAVANALGTMMLSVLSAAAGLSLGALV